MLRFRREKAIPRDGQRRIFYRSPDPTQARGGVKVIYDHVDILNRNGFEAYVLHRRKGFRCAWFENETKLTHVGGITPGENDFLVFPEIHAAHYVNARRKSSSYRVFSRLFSSPAKKVIFNQSGYLTLQGYAVDRHDPRTIYNDPDVLAVMVVSEDSKSYLEYVFPGKRVCCVPNAINSEIFRCESHKKPTICFMPRKNPGDAEQIINILKLRGVLDGFEVVPIDGINENDVATILRKSLVFLSFVYAEGFGLPAAEAMACGCIVVGYRGGGGQEFFDPAFSYPIETGNILEFARTVEGVIKLYRNDPAIMKQKGERASRYIAEHYTRQRQEDVLVGFWKETLAGCKA
jgi:hypothetical protein